MNNTDENTDKDSVLVVDDEPANLGLLFDALSRAGLRVLLAEDGSSAWEIVRRRPPRIMLLDVLMPDMSGFELFAGLQAEGLIDDIPVIFLTSLVNIEEKVRAFKMQAADYIVKPFDVAEVVARVEHHLFVGSLRRQLEEQIRRQKMANARLKALYQVSSLASRARELDVILNEALGIALEMLDSRIGVIYVLDEFPLDESAPAKAPPTVRRMAQVGLHPRETPIAMPLAPNGLFRSVLGNDKPLVIHDLDTDPRLQSVSRPGGHGRQHQVMLVAPMVADGEVLGIMNVVRDREHKFSQNEITFAAAVAEQLGVAVTRERMRIQSEQAIKLGERRHIARELHDSTAQSIHSMVLFSETIADLHQQGQHERAVQVTSRLNASARQALKELRLLVYELQLGVWIDDHWDLAHSLESRLQSVEAQAGIHTQLVVEEAAAWPRAWNRDLFHIVAEALNNALKHAQATEVTVTIRHDANMGSLIIDVVDNGRGFNTEGLRPGGMGLENMGARAAKLSGTIAIAPAPGGGTQITFTGPAGESV